MRNVVAVGVAAIMLEDQKEEEKSCFQNIFPFDPTSVIVQADH